MTVSNIAAVVVHHRSYDTVARTVDRLLGEGVVAAKLLVVDNSEEPSRREELAASLPPEVQIIFLSNSGYGAAVNQGVAWHAQNTDPTDFLLVSTHEALPESGCLSKLVSILHENASAGVVGPALVTGDGSDIIWSLGGYFSRILGLPRHFAHCTPRAQADLTRSRRVEWLDGAFLLFRRSVVETHKIDEDFFLYMEETDHQQLIRRLGWQVVVNPSAVVWQSSGGTPPYYQTRNIQLFQSKNGSKLQRAVSAPYIVGRTMVSDVLRRRGASQWGNLIAGWRAGRAFPRRSRPVVFPPKVVIVNPLGAALAHYTRALAETLRASGVEVEVRFIDEPSISGLGRRRWVSDYLRTLREVGRMRREPRKFQTLVTWPVLGFIDLILVRVLCGKSSTVVYHDPKPLVRSVGSDWLTARIVAAFRDLPSVVVHSPAAGEAMRGFGLDSSMEMLAHPMLRPVPDSVSEPRSGRPTVRVLGQFKNDRDLEVLEAMAADLVSECDLEIVGRGWPPVENWKVDPRFVSEEEMDYLVQSSDAIVIPYKRFFQSGIAIRALESGTPIVGRAASSLTDLYGSGSNLLVADPVAEEVTDRESWAAAVRHAIRHGNAEVNVAATSYFDSAVSDWRGWIFKTSSIRGGQ